jgi:hypothetical protein
MRCFAALICGPVIGILVYVVLWRLTRSLAAGDLIMISQFESRIPLRLRPPCRGMLQWIAGGSRTPATTVMLLIASQSEA